MTVMGQQALFTLNVKAPTGNVATSENHLQIRNTGFFLTTASRRRMRRLRIKTLLDVSP
jgi:hypothetical protein